MAAAILKTVTSTFDPKMKETYIVLAGASFVVMFITGIWPRVCLTKFQKVLEDHGEDPNQSFGIGKMKELAPNLFRSWLAGVVVTSVFSIAFLVFGLLAFLNR